MQIYLASPTGFSHEHKAYRDRVRAKLVALGHVVVDPWAMDFSTLFQNVGSLTYEERLKYNRWAGDFIARANYTALVGCDVVLGLLDGTEPDSGTVAECCFAAGLSKVVYGLRTDWRDSGDMPGIPINLQVLFFIEATGGKLFRSVEEVAIPLTFPFRYATVQA
jgi:nucleoside 2-deoxyribosyltransferase